MMRQNPVRDTLSSLDDDLLLSIISRLPLRDLVATSILSRRWRYLWRSTSNLWIDDRHFPSPQNITPSTIAYSVFRCFVDLTLRQLPNSPIIHRFKLCLFTHPCRAVRAQRWLNFISQQQQQPNLLRYFKIVTLKKVFPVDECVLLPVSIFNLQSLRFLHISIENCEETCWPTHASLPSLRILLLRRFKFLDTTRDAISTSCPRLERLTMDRCSGLPHLTVSCPFLVEFRMDKCYDFHDLVISSPRLELFRMNSTFVKVKQPVILSFGIQAPNLKTFQWIDCSLHHFMNALAPYAVNSVVHFKSLKSPGEDGRDFRFSLSKIRELTIDCISIVNCLIQERCLTSSFENVHVLKLLIDFNVIKFVGTICNALRCFPNLRTLEINTEKSVTNTGFDGIAVSGTKYGCDTNHSSLQKLIQVDIHKFRGTPCEMELIKFVLEIACSLQRITIKTSNKRMTSNLSVVAEELLKLPSTSSNLRFFFFPS